MDVLKPSFDSKGKSDMLYLVKSWTSWTHIKYRKVLSFMEENRAATQEKTGLYEYVKMPKNVRQIGVPLPGTKVYLEDYVITYLKQTFVNTDESRIAILLGKEGTEDAEHSIFLYGAVALEEEDILENGSIERETWDRVYEIIHRCFSGAQVYGWACGVNVWNSEMESKVRRLQKEEFAVEDRVLFLWDLCEKEEKIFTWQRAMVKELSGYYIYYDKNPQMQDFMLDKQQKPESIDADYQDRVTRSMRHVIEEKEEERQKKWQMITYCGAVAAGIAILFGVHMMIDSTARIKNMEKTVSALSEYVGHRQEEVETMSQQAKDVVKQIPFESQKAGKSTGGDSDKKNTGEVLAAVNDSRDDGAGSEAQETESGTETVRKEEEKGTEAPAGKETSSADTDAEQSHTKETTGLGKTAREKKGTAAGEMDISEEMALQAMKKNAQSYIVQKGDTLSQIVWKQYHDISYEKQVRKINGISDADKIYEGQCLLLPRFR